MGQYPNDGDPDDGGGDAVCWLHQLCPECGAMPAEDAPTGTCWRCGEPAETT